MKKYLSTEAYKIRQERRTSKFDRKKEKCKRNGVKKPKTLKQYKIDQYIPEIKYKKQLTAPENLDLFDNPEHTLKFCNKLMKYLSRPGTEVFLNLENVKDFSIDALTLIRAIMKSKTRDTNTRGNLPEDERVASEFKESGFFDDGFEVKPKNLPKPKGLFLNHSDDMVHAKTAANLVDFADHHIRLSDEEIKSCSRCLIEVMTNTHDHAGKNRYNKEKWFASVHCREGEGEASFCFIDLGVGILRGSSIQNWLRRLGMPMISYGKSLLLKDAFNGKMGSITNLPGRGLGLPTLKNYADEDSLPNLNVLTSNILGPIKSLDFKTIKEDMQGTVFRWRIKHD